MSYTMEINEEYTDAKNTTFEDIEPITNCTNVIYPNNTICMANPEEMLKPWVINSMFFDIVITYAVTFLIGLIGNVTVVIVMIRDRKARSATNLFLVSLAIADLLLLLVYAPLEALQYFVMQWDEAGSICKLAKYAEFLSAVASVLNLAAVTLERFIVIVFPMKSRSLCTLSNCRRGIVLVWVVALILSVPVLFTKVTYPMRFTNNVSTVTLYYCNDQKNGTMFAVYQLIILFGAPGILMLVCYTYVIRELWRSTLSMRLLTNNIQTTSGSRSTGVQRYATSPSRNTNQDVDAQSPVTEAMELVNAGGSLSTESSRQHPRTNRKCYDARRARKQVIKMLIIVIILFLICWGSRIIMELMIKVGLSSYSPSIYKLRVVLYVLPVIHSCINPFIYSFMSKNFRRSLQKQLSKLGCYKNNKENKSSRVPACRNNRPSTHRRPKPAASSFSSTYCATDHTKHTEVEGFVLMSPPNQANKQK